MTEKNLKEKFKESVKEAKDIGEKESSVKKILKIKTGEFLFAYTNSSVATCKHIKDAIDISDLTFKEVSYLMGNLKKVGYNPEIIEVKK